MQIIILWIAWLFSGFNLFAEQDSPPQRKNLIEAGYTSATFLDGLGFDQPTNKYINLIGNAPIYYISYRRYNKQNYFVRISHNTYAKDYNREKLYARKLELGDMVHRAYYNDALDFGKAFTLYELNDKNKLYLDLSISNNYRYHGGEQIHLSFPSSWERRWAYSEYKSYGIGCSTGIDFILLKRFSIGADLNYIHYFEKVRIFDESKAEQVNDIYTPNSNMITNHIKIGVLF